MAGAHRTPTNFLLPFTSSTPIPEKTSSISSIFTPISTPPFSISSISTPFPSKLTKRKNYLRPKILKTLPEPYPNKYNPLPNTPTTNPIIPILPLTEHTPNIPSHQLTGEDQNLSEISEPAGVIDGSGGKFFEISVLKFGFWLVGAFVFQTVCAVWLLGYANPNEKNDNLNDQGEFRDFEEFGLNGNNKLISKSNFLGVNGKLGSEKGGIIYVDENEMDRKMEEIRGMAKEAREREKVESKSNDDDVFVRSGIEKEVDNRLVRLRKMLKKSRERMPVLGVNHLRKEGEVDGWVDKKLGVEEDGGLVFKKKYMFRSPRIEGGGKPKGFMGRDDRCVSKMKDRRFDNGDKMLRSASVGDDGKWEIVQEETKSMQTPGKDLGKAKGRKKSSKEMGVAKDEPHTVISQDNSYGNERTQVQAVESGESSKVPAQNSQIFTQENQNKTAISNKHDVLSRNGSVTSNKLANNVGDKNTDSKNDLWWSSLPYVLTVLMRRGHNGEGPNGFFTLRSISHEEGDSSCIVAFEDRGDATNFCYLLQSFFEDLDDFNAEIIPLSKKDLDGSVKLNNMKVFVVKKGQLKLYAGQPLPEVEMALRSLVGRS